MCPRFPNCGFETAKGAFIYFSSCSYYHPPPPYLLSPPPLFPHPDTTNCRKMHSPSHPTPHDQVPITMLSQRVTSLEEHITGLEKQISALTTSASPEDNSETSQAAELESVEDLETKLGPIQQNLVQLSSFKDIVSDQLNTLQTDVSVLKKDITQRKNAGDNSEFQSIENGTTGNARMDDEAPDTHLSGPPDIKQPPKEIADMITDLETRLESKFTNNEQNLSNLEEKINNLKDQQFKDLEHKIEKQVQTSLTKTNVDIRSLEQKVTENINNITNLETTMQNNKVAGKKDIANLSTAIETSQQMIAQIVPNNAKLVKVLQNRIEEVAKEARNRPCKLVEGLNNRLESLEYSKEKNSKFISDLICILSDSTAPQKSFEDFKQLIRFNKIDQLGHFLNPPELTTKICYFFNQPSKT